MKRLVPEKLNVDYLTGTSPGILVLPRRYTLTHSDRTGDLFLTIGGDYDRKQISGLYTRLMRDEVLAEITGENGASVLKVYCHISGGFVLGTAGWRYRIFKSELPLVLEAFRYGDSALFDENPELDRLPVRVFFQSTSRKFNRTENCGVIADYV